jgi:predicted transcriptional regulator
MADKSIHRMGDLQLRILHVLWEKGESSVAEVLGKLEGPHAYTTIATMLRKMEGRGLVRHREEGRKFIYAAAVSSDDVSQGLANRLIDRLFAGSLAGAVSHLLETRDVDSAELDELERLVKEHRRRQQTDQVLANNARQDTKKPQREGRR